MVVMGGAVPSGLVCAAHAAGARVVKGQVLDVDASDAATLAGWVAAANSSVAAAGADGVNILAVRRQSANSTDVEALGIALRALRQALGDAAQVSASVPLQQLASAEWKRLGRDASSAADFLVLQAFDQCMGAKQPAPSIGLTHLNEALQTAGSILPLNRIVVALGWHGWDFRCRGAASQAASGKYSYATCVSTPPTGASWHGWNVQRSVDYISSQWVRSATVSPPVLDNATATMRLETTDNTGVAHVVLYDNEATLRRKYAACAQAKVRGVGVFTADMVSYVGDASAQRLAAAMWASLDAFRAAGPSPNSPVAAGDSLTSHHNKRPQLLAARFRRQLGLGSDEFIPGYDPCKRRGAARRQPSASCSDGLLCLSPLPNDLAQHESGGCYPVRPSISFVARTLVPPLPPTFRPEEATVYYYLNLVMPDDGNSDVTNSTSGYGFMNQ